MQQAAPDARSYGVTVSGPTRVGVVIADDHPLIVGGLAAVIDADPGMHVIARAADGRTALELCRKHKPRVAVFDLHMPEMEGAEAIGFLRRSHPAVAVIVLSMYARDEDVRRCFQAGARGYVLKTAPAEEILAAIRTVAHGGRHVPDAIAERLAVPPPGSGLTEREAQVLRELVRAKSNKEIAESLGVRESTVKWHVNALLAKLGVEDRVQAVVHALRRGLARLDE